MTLTTFPVLTNVRELHYHHHQQQQEQRLQQLLKQQQKSEEHNCYSPLSLPPQEEQHDNFSTSSSLFLQNHKHYNNTYIKDNKSKSQNKNNSLKSHRSIRLHYPVVLSSAILMVVMTGLVRARPFVPSRTLSCLDPKVVFQRSSTARIISTYSAERQQQQSITCFALRQNSSNSATGSPSTKSGSTTQASRMIARPNQMISCGRGGVFGVVSRILSQSPLQSKVLSPYYNDFQNSHRLYSGRNKDDEKESPISGVVGKAVSVATNIAKSILPSSWFRSEEEKKRALARKEVSDEVSGTISDMLRDAPLSVRMFGKAVAPLISSVAGSFADTMAEQQRSVQQIIDQAQLMMQNDDAVLRALGNNIGGTGNIIVEVGTPFSQSSSTTSINGQTTSRVELAFPVYCNSPNAIRSNGPSNAIARVSASNGFIQFLQLEMNDGRRIQVDTSMSQTSSSSKSKYASIKSSKNKQSDIIEAEIIEKQQERY